MTSQTDVKRVAEVRDQVAVRYQDIANVFPKHDRQKLIDASIVGAGTELIRGPSGAVEEVIVSSQRIKAIGAAAAALKQKYPHLFREPSRSTYVRK